MCAASCNDSQSAAASANVNLIAARRQRFSHDAFEQDSDMVERDAGLRFIQDARFDAFSRQ